MLELALWLACCLGPGSGQDAVQAVRAAFEAGRLDRALEAAGEIEDGSLAAEWRFHVLYHGGDLSGALAAVRAAERNFPEHPRLLENGARCALALGLGELAEEQVLALLATPLESDARARAQDLLARAQELVARERQARASVARSQGVTLVLALAACLALWGLARAS